MLLLKNLHHILLRYSNQFYFEKYLTKTLSLTLDKKYSNLIKGTFIIINTPWSTSMTVLKYDSCDNKKEEMMSIKAAADKKANLMDIGTYIVFSNAIGSHLTRQKYSGLIISFFDLGFQISSSSKR
jgi:hypothetical protein